MSEEIEFSHLGTPEEIVQKLKNAKIFSEQDFLNLSVSTLAQRYGLNCDQISTLKRNVFKQTFESLRMCPEAVYDTNLFGQLKGNHLYEIYGGPGTGKTQLCSFLAVKFSQDIQHGKVLYLDTKNDLSYRRLNDFAQREGSPPNLLMSKVFDIHQAIKLTGKLCEEKEDSVTISLLILDNITSLVLPLVDDDDVSDVFCQVGELIGNLKEISTRQNCPVIITNNATKNYTIPALGKFLEHAADIQFSIQHHQEEGTRLLKLCRGSEDSLQSLLEFTITKTGIDIKT